MCDLDMLKTYLDNLFTGFPQKLWKTVKNPMVIKSCIIASCLLILSSCAYFRGTKDQGKVTQESQKPDASKSAEQKKASEAVQPAPAEKAPKAAKEAPKGKPSPESGIIDMREEEVRKKYGEPDIVSKTLENHIIWTYKPSWKILPDNRGTLYIEFENGKVIKIVKAR
jgi:hypothetical protein